MITEDYVSFETAKLLKEKGFNDKCRAFWKVWNGNTTLIECNSAQVFDSCYNSTLEKYNDEGELNIAAPTLQMAMKWLREIHSIFICILFLEDNGKYGFTIENTISRKFIITSKNDEYPTYEQTCEAAIKYYLENKF